VIATLGFKQWFGASKVVDEDGRPKVMYHGTDAEEEFTRFEVTEDVGFHFGPPETANARLVQIEAFDRARIIPVYLFIKRPLRLPDLMTWGPGEVILALGEAGVLTNSSPSDQPQGLGRGYFFSEGCSTPRSPCCWSTWIFAAVLSSARRSKITPRCASPSYSERTSSMV
jgi:hypothetical protein